MVRLNAEQIDNLSESSIDLVLGHVNTLGSTETEATDCRDLIDCIDWEDFVDEG